jgi:hypothetical protein
MTRRWLIPVTIISTIAVVAAIIVLAGGSSGGTSGTTPSTTSTTNVNESVSKVDDQDPNQSGCAPTGEYLPGISVPVIAPNGAQRGNLVLRRSTACQAVWGRVNGLEGHRRYLVEIDLYRPNDHKQLLFHDADFKTYVFSNMLSERPGCVYATAYLAQGKRRGPTARTPCR